MPLSFATDHEVLEVFTVEEAINKMGFGVFQLVVSLLAGFMWVSIYQETTLCVCVHTLL